MVLLCSLVALDQKWDGCPEPSPIRLAWTLHWTPLCRSLETAWSTASSILHFHLLWTDAARPFTVLSLDSLNWSTRQVLCLYPRPMDFCGSCRIFFAKDTCVRETPREDQPLPKVAVRYFVHVAGQGIWYSHYIQWQQSTMEQCEVITTATVSLELGCYESLQVLPLAVSTHVQQYA